MQKSSNIWTGGNLALISGETAKIQGSNVASGGDMLIDAQNVEILSAQETTMSTSDTKSAHINVTINMGGGGSVSADFGMSGSRSDSTAHVNSHLSGNNITIRSKQDTTVRGGNVNAENNLDLNVGGNLLVESVQDKSSSGGYSFGISGGGSANSGNGGVNFSVSESKSKWVNEQSGLTGGNVNIYVENKTTLKGAVIASTSSDPANLKLDTGSFEYVNVKDKSTSFNIGASMGFGLSFNEKAEDKFSATYNTSANYGYSDKRQTNFATIGEGTIIVRDGKSDLSKLRRDVATAQYSTFDVGTKGGFVVDDKLVTAVAATANYTYDLATKPGETIDRTIDAAKAGYNETKRILTQYYDGVKGAVVTTLDGLEKTKNLVGDGHFVTNEELPKALAQDECRKLWESGEMETKIVGKYREKIFGENNSQFKKDSIDKTDGKLKELYSLGLDSEGAVLREVLILRDDLANYKYEQAKQAKQQSESNLYGDILLNDDYSTAYDTDSRGNLIRNGQTITKNAIENIDDPELKGILIDKRNAIIHSKDGASEGFTNPVFVAQVLGGDLLDIQQSLIPYDFVEGKWLTKEDWGLTVAAAIIPGMSGKIGREIKEGVEGIVEREIKNGIADYSKIGSTGKYGEEQLKKLGGDSHQYFKTTENPEARIIDQLVDREAHESKVGYQSLTQSNKIQIAKDAELIGKTEIDSSTWHFYKSPVTGKGGASKNLINELDKNDIKYIIEK